MSRVALTEVILLATQNPSYARGVELFVFDRNTFDAVPLYSTEGGGGEISQPLIADAGGRPRSEAGGTAWIEEGSYDLVINGQRVPWEASKGGAGGGSVTSVAGRAGAVILAMADITDAGTAATEDVGAAGEAGKVLAADDPTTTDARTPKAHAASHKTGGTDPLAAADIGAATKAEVEAKQDAATAATDAELAIEKEAREAADALRQLLSGKGQPNGYAGLEAAGKVPVAQLPSAIMEYQGTWNASTNTPALADGAGSGGDVYRVSVAGERNLGSGVIEFAVGDYAVYNGTTWEKSDTTDAVASVAGKKGAVTLAQADIEGLVAALEGKQPLDGDLTSIAALVTTAFGRSLLTQANAAAALATLGAEASANKVQTLSGESEAEYPSEKAVQAGLATKQVLDADLTAIAGLSPADGATLVRSGGSWAALAIGSSGQQLVVRSDGTLAYQNVEIWVSAWGVKADGATDDATAAQNTINAAAESGGIARFASGTHIFGSTLTAKSKVRILGAGEELTIFKLKNGANTDLIKSASYGTAGIRDFSIRGVTLDGNKANNSSGSCLLLDGQKLAIEDVEAHHAAVDNINVQMSEEKVLDTEGGDESQMRHVRCWLAGSRNLRWNVRDGHLTDVICIHKDEGATLTNLLIDTNGFSVKLTDCHAWGKSKYAWQVKGSINALNCTAEGGVTANVIWEGDNSLWLGGEVFKDGSENGKVGFLWANEKGFSTIIAGVQIRGCTEPLKFTGNGDGSQISAIVEIEAGKKVVNGTPSANGVAFDIWEHGGGTVGVAQKKRRKAPEAANILLEHLVDADTNARYELRADGLMLWGPGNAGTDVWLFRPEKEALKVAGRWLIEKKSEEVASANTMTVKDGIFFVKVSGTTEIKKINATTDGHRITLKFAGALTVKNGENLKLREDMVTTADSTLTLVCDGTNWYEVARDTYQKAVAPTALAERAETTEFEPSATRTTIVTGRFETATATRTKIKIEVGGVIVVEEEVSVAATGVSVLTFCFAVPAGAKWKWTKIEGTVVASSFKTSYTVI